MDYNARFYSPHLGRFVSADTIVQNPANAKSFDRYLYVLANPLRYIDPSDHRTCEDMPWECENGEWRDTGPAIYNSIYIFTGGPGISHTFAPSTQSWTSAERSAAVAEGMIAAEGFAQVINAYISALNAKMPQFGESPIPYVTPTEAFLMVHNGRPVELVRSSENRSYSGECFGSNTIVFYNVSDTWTDPETNVEYSIVDSDYIVDHPHVVLHELGHAFNNVIGGDGAGGVPAGLMRPMVAGVIDHVNEVGGFYGYAGAFNDFQFGYSSALPSSEEFADMYVGWALNRWDLTVQLGIDRQFHMNTVMPGYIISGWLR